MPNWLAGAVARRLSSERGPLAWASVRATFLCQLALRTRALAESARYGGRPFAERRNGWQKLPVHL